MRYFDRTQLRTNLPVVMTTAFLIGLATSQVFAQQPTNRQNSAYIPNLAASAAASPRPKPPAPAAIRGITSNPIGTADSAATGSVAANHHTKTASKSSAKRSYDEPAATAPDESAPVAATSASNRQSVKTKLVSTDDCHSAATAIAPSASTAAGHFDLPERTDESCSTSGRSSQPVAFSESAGCKANIADQHAADAKAEDAAEPTGHQAPWQGQPRAYPGSEPGC